MADLVVRGSLAPRDARKPANDPFRGWHTFHHQLGFWTPKRVLGIKLIRQRLLPAIKV